MGGLLSCPGRQLSPKSGSQKCEWGRGKEEWGLHACSHVVWSTMSMRLTPCRHLKLDLQGEISLAFPKPQAAAIPLSCIPPLPKIVQKREPAGLDWMPKLFQSQRAMSKFYEDCCDLAIPHVSLVQRIHVVKWALAFSSLLPPWASCLKLNTWQKRVSDQIKYIIKHKAHSGL